MTSRRTVLAGAATGLALNFGWLMRALAADKVAEGVRRITGEASINGQPASQGLQVRPGDTVVTGPNGDIVFVVGRDAFMVRAESKVARRRYWCSMCCARSIGPATNCGKKAT